MIIGTLFLSNQYLPQIIANWDIANCMASYVLPEKNGRCCKVFEKNDTYEFSNGLWGSALNRDYDHYKL